MEKEYAGLARSLLEYIAQTQQVQDLKRQGCNNFTFSGHLSVLLGYGAFDTFSGRAAKICAKADLKPGGPGEPSTDMREQKRQ